MNTAIILNVTTYLSLTQPNPVSQKISSYTANSHQQISFERNQIVLLNVPPMFQNVHTEYTCDMIINNIFNLFSCYVFNF